MLFYSTQHKSSPVSLREAVLQSMPDDGGLYMPQKIEKLPNNWLYDALNWSFQELSVNLAKHLLQDSIPAKALEEIVVQAINFEAPLIRLGNGNISILELFHGPSLAFKDFGARFMAQLMAYFVKDESQELNILVATSGDTGGAVAMGFWNKPGIRVRILYPSGRVSELQEKQLTTLGGNIEAFEIDGSFDDCQRMVKQAFLDKDLQQKLKMSSANSINISRLIPQTFYYFRAWQQLMQQKPNATDWSFSIPSGNFGNIAAGLIAKHIGLPAFHCIAATNINDVVPHYVQTGVFEPRHSVRTLSSAMDVGNPSNFVRILDLYRNDYAQIKNDMPAYGFTDAQTRQAMLSLFDLQQYVACPHTAVGFLGAQVHLRHYPQHEVVCLSTAHPAKFASLVNQTLETEIPIPEELQEIMDKPKHAIHLNPDFDSFKMYLMDNQ
ncbi:MAG: threonine synthase [Chitinophagales bacterium]|nr:threonine synthase [Bacteroidota bacterium]MCB9044071.1 threonine synthase [Chitinophagales bacterium]